MSREALRARLEEAVAACSSVDSTSYAVWGALAAYAPHLGISGRWLDDAEDLEIEAIKEHARPRRVSWQNAQAEARSRMGWWFACYVREGLPFTASAVLSLRWSAVAMRACAELYRAAA